MQKQRLFALVAGLVIVLAAIWYFLRRADTHEATPQAVQEEIEREAEPAPAPSAPEPAPTARGAPAAPPSAPYPYKEEVVTSDGIPIMPANGPRPDGPVHPHPITPQHERIFAENRMIGALNGAMDVKDAPGMRRLLEQYRREYPEDDNDLQDGYAVIADCLEQPGAPSRQAAERWLRAHNGSTLKRFVNRHCLEAATP